MNFRPGDVILISLFVAFHQSSGDKIRPAVVLLDAGDDDVVVAPITSQSRASDFDLPMIHWREAGLNVASTVRVHKLAVRPKIHVFRRIGKLSAADHQGV